MRLIFSTAGGLAAGFAVYALAARALEKAGRALTRRHLLWMVPLCAVLGALAALLQEKPLDITLLTILGALLLLVSVVDAASMRIPNAYAIALAALCAAAVAAGTGPPVPDALLGTLLGGGLLWLIKLLWGGLGGGDVKLMAALGLWLGWTGVMPTFLAAAFAGGLTILLLRPLGVRVKRDTAVPFGAALSFGAYVVIILKLCA